MDIVEEFPQTRRDLDDKRWPAIRPPILGKSYIQDRSCIPGSVYLHYLERQKPH